MCMKVHACYIDPYSIKNINSVKYSCPISIQNREIYNLDTILILRKEKEK